MKNMVFKSDGRFFILLHTEAAPSDAEWTAFVTATEVAARQAGKDFSQLRQLVITDGGGPSSTQRKQANAMLGGSTIRVAVVSQSTAIRGVVTALSWFNSLIKAFNPDELKEALSYLEVPEGADDKVMRDIRTLREQLGAKALRFIKG